MSILRITNVSPGNLWLRDLYTELSPGETATIKRTPAEMGDMVGLQEYLANGKVVVDIDLEAYESSGELVPVWPLGLNGRPAVPTTVALPLLNNRLGDTRLVIDILQQFAWNGTVWVGIGGGGGGGVTSVTASLPLSSSGGATPAISLGTVGVANGGTGQTSLTANAVVLGNGALAVQTVAPGTSGNVLTSDGTTWSSAPSSATPPGGGVGDLQINDGVGGFAGSTDLSFGAQTLEVNNTVRVTDGGNTLTVQPTFIGSDAATLTLDAASTVQVGGVAGVSIGGIYTLPAVVGAAGEVLTTDGSGSASWVASGGGAGVSAVSATAPLLSSGSSTPDISIDTAGASNGDVLTFNGAAWAAAAPAPGAVFAGALTIYVDPTNGTDAPGGGTLGQPYASINYAYSQVPSLGAPSNTVYNASVGQFVTEKLVFQLAPGRYAGDTGKATGTQTIATLQDTTKAWRINEFAGATVNLTGGTGSGQTATVVSNTANTLTISGSWTTTPVDASTTYSVSTNVTLGFKRARVQLIGNGVQIVGNVTLAAVRADFPASNMQSIRASFPAPWTGAGALTTFEITGAVGGGVEADASSDPLLVTGLSTLLFNEPTFPGSNLGANWDANYGQFYFYANRANLIGGQVIATAYTIPTINGLPTCVIENDGCTIGEASSPVRSYLGAVPYAYASSPSTWNLGTGQATGTQSSTTLQDTTKAWTVNQYAGATVTLTGGQGSGQTATVVSNTANTLTVTPAWSPLLPLANSTGYSLIGTANKAPSGVITLKTHNSTLGAAIGPTLVIGEIDGCRIYDIDRTMLGTVDNGGVTGSPSTSYLGMVVNQFRVYSGTGIPASRYQIGSSGSGVRYKMDSTSYTTLAFSRSTTTGILTPRTLNIPTSAGTATAGAATTITDTSKAFTTNQWVGGTITLTGGIGSGQTRTVSSNTGTVITVSPAWSPIPTAGTTYTVSALVAYDLLDDSRSLAYTPTTPSQWLDPDPTTVGSALDKVGALANSASLTGKMIWVDSVNGNDSTAARGNDGLPFLTVEAALAVALNGDVVMVRPGTYNVTATLTLPTGVAMRGYNRENTIIQKLLVTADTTLLTMGASSSIQDLSFKLTSTGHHTLKGVLWPGTTTATAHADHCYIDVDNSTAGDAGTSNVYGVHVTATSTPARITSVASNDVIVNVTSAGLGNKRGVLLDTSIAYFRNESCIYSAVRTGAAAGSYIGGEINVLGGILAMNSGGYEGTSADMSETAGSLEVLGVDLTNDNANGKGFLVTQASPRFTWGIIGVVPSGSGTRYLYPGTANDSGVEIFTRLAAKGIVKSLIVRSRVAPGGGTDVYTLRKNGVDTALTVSLTGAAVSAQILTASVSFSSSDDLSVSVSSTGGTGADVVIVAEIY